MKAVKVLRFHKLVAGVSGVALCVGSIGVASAVSADGIQTESSAYVSSSRSDVAGEYRDAVEDFDEENPRDVVQLAQAAADYVDGDMNVEDADVDTSVLTDSFVSVEGVDGSTMVDGMEVLSSDADSMDIVHRATAGGEQFIAVLGDEQSARELSYAFDLDGQTQLKKRADGGVDIVRETMEEEILPGESERVENAAMAIIGKDNITDEDIEQLTEEQIEALAAIPDEQTQIRTTREVVGEIEAPWAIDAEGKTLPTHYEVQGDTLIQKITTNAQTTYPITADPSIFWWIKKASSCIAGTASLLAFAPGKVATVSAKVYKVLKGGKTVRLKNAYRAWMNLGGSNSTRFKTIAREVKKFAVNIKNTRSFTKARNIMRGQKTGANTYNFLINGAGSVADLMGIKSCYDIVVEASK
ncbi:MAG: hypothetical protein J6M18_05845 [Actinomycetaceae bacterium]|nr:hypothetical protein [Actinomycetaceae bacterium]